MTTSMYGTQVKLEDTDDPTTAATDDEPETRDGLTFETAIPVESPANPGTLDEAARKREKKRRKALKATDKKSLKAKLKEKKNSTKVQAVTFPMVALIDEQVRTSIPKELVAKVKEAKSKKHIISSTYPYPKQMKKSHYEEEIELLQIELVKMQA